MPVQLTCQNCDKHFWVKPRDSGRKFCERTCMDAYESIHGRPAAVVPMLTFVCKQCGNPFEMKPSIAAAVRKKWNRDPLYCSTLCAGEAKKLSDEKWQVTCIQCGKLMPIQRRPGGTINRQKRLCSTKCRSEFRTLSYQTNNPNQEVTRHKYKNGYWRVVVPGRDGDRSRELLEHRYVMEQHLGRLLLPNETVHHIDGDRSRNVIANLRLFSSRHGPGQDVADKIAYAAEMFRLYPEFARAIGLALVEVEPVPEELFLPTHETLEDHEVISTPT